MGIKELIQKLRGEPEPEEEEYGPRPINDKVLNSLERERQTQINEMRKAELKKVIADYKREKMRRGLYGIGEKKDDRSYLGSVKAKKVEVMNNKRKIMHQQSLMREKSILKGRTMLDDGKRQFKEKKKRSMFI